jgi:formiminotetrahydrofolate cyclodeaminase
LFLVRRPSIDAVVPDLTPERHLYLLATAAERQVGNAPVDVPPLLDLSVRAFLEALRSPAPPPAGGAAAALAGALGSALLEMVAGLTMGRPQFRAVDQEARRIAAAAAERQARFQHLFVMEAHAFGRLLQAYSERGHSEADRQERLAAISTELVFATAVPMEIAQESRQLLELCEAAARVAAPAVLADVAVAVRLADAALQGAAANVRVALPSLNDRARARQLEDELLRAQRSGEAQLQRSFELIETRMPRGSA